MLRVFVVSPLPAVRAGLRALLSGAEDCRVVGEGADVEAAGATALDVAPDVLVVDATPDFDVREIAEVTAPGHGVWAPRAIILGPVANDARLPAEMPGRAWGYLSRQSSAEQLVAAVRAVGHGLMAVDPGVGSHLLSQPSPFGMPADSQLGTEGEELTGREREVLQLVALGLANKHIARRLGISEHTVKFHVAAILAKLGAASRTEAVHLGTRRGLVAL